MSCSSQYTLPDTTNYCNSINDTYQIPNFCTTAGVAGDSRRETYCEKLGAPGEWTKSNDQGSTCNYYDCDGSVSKWTGNDTCCGACCKIIGAGAKCKRVGFTGDPNKCCLNDWNCSKGTSNSTCFSDETKQNTCADGSGGKPNYRRITSSDCRNTLYDYCTGNMTTDDYGSTQWLDRFYGENSCVDAILKNVYYIPGTSFECGVTGMAVSKNFSGDGFFWSQKVVSEVFKHYQDNGYDIGALPGYKNYNTFQNILYNICIEVPGLCQASLKNSCKNYNAEKLSNNPQLNAWCGCNMSKEQYETYSTKYNISPECTPNCNRAGVIPISGLDGKAITCKQDVCIIDNVNLNLMKSSGEGNINFEQVCGYCPSGNCSCLISNVDIKAVNSFFNQSNIDVKQTCASTTCSAFNNQKIGPNEVPFNCDKYENPLTIYNDNVEKQIKKSNVRYTIWLMIFFGFIAMFIVIFWFLKRRGYREPLPIKNNYSNSFNFSVDSKSVKNNKNSSLDF